MNRYYYNSAAPFLHPCLPLLLWCTLCFTSELFSQQLPPQERFRHLTIDDGLSQNAIQALLQDHLGFIWIGTKDGLNRYDGYEFSVFQHWPGDRTSLSNNFILDIFEDRDQKLWIGTRNGLNRYNELDGSFETFQFAEFATDLSPHVAISDIAQDTDGNLWLAISGRYLIQLPFENDSIAIRQPILVSDAFSNILHLHHDGQHLWVGDRSGLYRFDNSGMEVSRFTQFGQQVGTVPVGADSTVSYIADAQHPDYLWVGGARGLLYFEKKTGKYQLFSDQNYKSISRWGGRTTCILPDSTDGKVWAGSFAELVKLDPITGKYQYYDSRMNDRFGFHGVGVLAAITDRSGQLWFGTNGYGINILDARNNQIKTLEYQLPEESLVKNFSIRSIFKDRDDNVWIGSRVLYRWDRVKREITSYEAGLDRPTAMGNAPVYSIIQDREGWLWLASTQGVYRYRTQDSTVVYYTYRPEEPGGLPEKMTGHVYEDSKGQIWVVSRSYFSKLDRKTGKFTSLRYRSNQLQDPVFVRIVEDQYGKFWMNSDIGLIHFDPGSWAMRTYQHDPEDKQSISTNDLRHLCPDPREPDRYLWLATAGGGINKFDMLSGKCRRISTAHGLPDNVVYGILPDEEGNLWMSTNKGISRFDPVGFTFKNYDARDGLQSNEFNSGAYFRAEDGEMFFGGILGLNYFYPRQLVDKQYTPPVYITDLQIGNQFIHPGDSTGILQRHMLYQEQITLDYRDDVVTFYFAAMDFSAPEKNQFKYQLSGWDRQWVEAGSRRSATYTNLPPGEYTFSVQGTNSDGIWNETAAAIRLLITPPFWMTWWAKMVYALILSAIFYTLIIYQRKRTQLKHQLAMEKIEKRKLQELDELKSKFFTDIAHEFRTPLTLILGPIDQLKEKLSQVADSKLLSMMQQNAGQLLLMVDQIMNLARLETGSEQLHPRSGELIGLLLGVTESFRSMAEVRNIRLSLTSDLATAQGTFDHQKIEQILSNLLSNAIKYSREGDAVQVIIEDVLIISGGQETPLPFTFRVKDTGPGIVASSQPFIFQRFYRGEHRGGEERNGSGVGLALVKELVDLHGGRITLESGEDTGTCFSVTLPLSLSACKREVITTVYQETAPQPAIALPASVFSGRENRDREQLILIIDDNTAVRAFISQILQETFDTAEASTGSEGIALAKKLMPDLIITDIMMPGMNGYEVCEYLTQSALTSHIPVIMLTAKATREDQFKGYVVGADAYLTKPFKREELQLRIRTLIEKRQILQAKFSALTPGFEKVLYRNETENAFLQTVLDLLQSEVSNPDLGIAQLARAVHMSERQLRRKFNVAVGQSPNQFIRTFRLRKAYELLRSGDRNVSEVCFEVGFNNVSYFSKCFREEYGLSPSEI